MVSLADLAKKKSAPATTQPSAVEQAQKQTEKPVTKPGGLNLAGLSKVASAVESAPAAEAVSSVTLPTENKQITLETGAATAEATGVSSALAPPSQFSDEQAPERTLAEGLSEQQLGFVKLLDSVYELHHDPEAVKSAIVRIMTEMRQAPHLMDLLVDDDVTAIMKRMKHILGFRKAEATKAKKTRKPSAKKAQAKAEMEAALAEAGIDFD